MTDDEFFKQVIKGACELEDGETGMRNCIDQFCADKGIDQATADQVYRDWFKQEAILHGIPLDVIEGKRSLRDYFSESYINHQCNRAQAVES